MMFTLKSILALITVVGALSSQYPQLHGACALGAHILGLYAVA